MPESSFDDGDVDRVLAYVMEARPDTGELARSLLERGGLVIEAWGPLQMAVYHLEVRRGNWEVMFHSERGHVEAASFRRAGPPTREKCRPIGLAVLAWARSHDVTFRLETLADLDQDLAAHGADALDWLDAGNEPVVERLYQAWWDGVQRIGYSSARLRDPQLAADVIARLEEAAR
ncbi:hypothetical protein [Pseudactinotalea sp.]|uniref:hypothetical protein n=1 Tax=Pseudactinotalea sp. TaxID=1926260 RepID=UPI003B3BD5C2